MPRSARFFHQKLSLDNLIWLGDENILNLGEQTNAVLAVYTYGDTKAQLLVVEYPDAAMAEAAHAALEGSDLENLAAAGQGNQSLVAVFETPDRAIAQGRLQKALEKLTDQLSAIGHQPSAITYPLSLNLQSYLTRMLYSDTILALCVGG